MDEEKPQSQEHQSPRTKFGSFIDYMIGIAKTFEGWMGGLLFSVPLYFILTSTGQSERGAMLLSASIFLVIAGYFQFLKERRRAEAAEAVRQRIKCEVLKVLLIEDKYPPHVQDKTLSVLVLLKIENANLQTHLDEFRISAHQLHAAALTTEMTRTPQSLLIQGSAGLHDIHPEEYIYDNKCVPLPIPPRAFLRRWVRFVFDGHEHRNPLVSPGVRYVVSFRDVDGNTYSPEGILDGVDQGRWAQYLNEKPKP